MKLQDFFLILRIFKIMLFFEDQRKYKYEAFFLFLIVCVSAGIVAFIGSVLGGAIGQTQLFIGGTIGGLLALGLGGGLLNRVEIELKPTTIGGCIGFIIATIIALNNLHKPVIPLLSTSLTGIGTLIAVGFQRKLLSR